MKKNFDMGLRAYKRSQLVGYKSLMVKKIQRDEEIEIRGRMLVEASQYRAVELEEEIRANLLKQRQQQAVAAATSSSIKKGASSLTLLSSSSIKTLSVDDTTLAHWLVNRIEMKREFCSISAGGSIRPFQFVDSEFPPSADSVGMLSRKDITSLVRTKKWRPSRR
jgi:hypothetical protein